MRLVDRRPGREPAARRSQAGVNANPSPQPDITGQEGERLALGEGEKELEERARLLSVPGLHCCRSLGSGGAAAAAAAGTRCAATGSPHAEHPSPSRPSSWPQSPAPTAWAPSPPRRPPAAWEPPATLGGPPAMDACKLEPSGRV